MKLGLMTKDECIDFVEFNITGTNQMYQRCDNESLYLNAQIFNIFVGCFERSNHLFDILGSTLYDIRKMIPLRNELEVNFNVLRQIDTLNEFKHYVLGIFLGKNLLEELEQADAYWEKRWKFYLRKLMLINKNLIALVDRCLEEEKVLWFIGY